jgi:hypothetical protein
MVPKLSDLIKDWAEANKWPIKVTPSKQYIDLVWVETVQLVPTTQRTGVPAYIGTIDDSIAIFAPSPNETIENLRPEDPEFFTKLGTCIRNVFNSFPQLDSSVLPK